MTTVERAAPGIRPGRAPASPRRRSGLGKTLLALAVIAFAFALPLRGMLRSQGPAMEEGFMLVFPERFLRGDIPNRDFLHLYGPGSIWVLAGWFEVLGVRLVAERLFGLLQEMGIVLGVYGLARHWGRAVGVLGALVSVMLVVPPIGLTALAWPGGVALGVLGLVALLEGRRRLESHRRVALRWAVVGGVVSGFALLYRLDLVVAVGLGALAAWWGAPRELRRRFATGFAIGVSGYLFQIATAGAGATFKGMVLDPVVYLRGGRRLPIPPPWDHLNGYLQRVGETKRFHWPFPTLTTPQQLALWFYLLLATVVVLVLVGRWAVRRDPRRFQARVLLAGALFSVGLVPQAVQRVDSTHFAWVSCVPMALLPAAIAEILHARVPGWSGRVRGIIAGGAVAALFVFVLPHYTTTTYTDFVYQTFGAQRQAFAIKRGGRVFYYGRKDVKDAAQALVNDVPKLAAPGGRLLVGTTDLRKTPYSDAYLYYLLPEYPPATYYIEMDPGVANRKGSRLARDVASAQIAILSAVWRNWDEPNDTRRVGSPVPNQVLRRDLCEVKPYGDAYQLWLRRPRGATCAQVRARAAAILART